MSRTEEDLLVYVPEPQPAQPEEDFVGIVRRAMRDLGPGHRQMWLAGSLHRHIGTVSRWLRGETKPSPEDRNAVYAALRSEEELHRRGDCTKGRFLSAHRLGDVLRPSFTPQRATARLTIAESIPDRVAA